MSFSSDTTQIEDSLLRSAYSVYFLFVHELSVFFVRICRRSCVFFSCLILHFVSLLSIEGNSI